MKTWLQKPTITFLFVYYYYSIIITAIIIIIIIGILYSKEELTPGKCWGVSAIIIIIIRLKTKAEFVWDLMIRCH